MNAPITPANMIDALRVIVTLPWKALDKADHDLFADAGADARICHEVPLLGQRIICDAFGIPHFEWGMLAIIGGDGLQIELHGTDNEGEPQAYAIPLALTQH